LTLTAIPVPPLPDPSALPQEALEFVGEIVTVLPDSITVRGGLSTYSTRESRNLVLDEGSLLLLDDRTPLGYVWETFGPTTLPHYLVRVQRKEPTPILTTTPHTPTDAEPVHDQAVPGNENDTRSLPTSSLASTPHDHFDPTKIFVTRAIYHIPSLSKFVFPSALARLKGSDASNIHDEEPAENELEFSDDEAEAAYKRLRCAFH
jgi:H/ACA ribonucleoprotein complex non-core subunit NAF1